MTAGERFIQSAPLKERFRDAHERRAYQRTLEVARRIVDDPALLEKGRAFLDRFVKDDPRQRRVYVLWTEILRLEPEQVVRRLIADDEQGAFLRETAPVFTTISPETARHLVSRSA